MILDSFYNNSNFKQVSAVIQSRTVAKDAAGRPSETWATLATINVWQWIEAATETNRNDRFEGMETGKIVIDPETVSFSVTNAHRVTIGGVKYQIQGVDKVFGMSEVIVLNYTKDNRG